MTTSLYDHPLYGEKYNSSKVNGTDYGDSNYDAIKDAKRKFFHHPEKYIPRRIYHGSTRSTHHSTDRGTGRVTVLIEHGGGCTATSLSDNIGLAITDNFPEVRFTDIDGRFDSFEIFLDGRCLFSRIAQGGYPDEDEVLEAVYRARAGKTFYPLERGESSVCTIL